MVKKYNDHLNQAINSEHIIQQLSELYEKGITELTANQQTELNHIDKKTAGKHGSLLLRGRVTRRHISVSGGNLGIPDENMVHKYMDAMLTFRSSNHYGH